MNASHREKFTIICIFNIAFLGFFYGNEAEGDSKALKGVNLEVVS
jgi:hypothetical protein